MKIVISGGSGFIGQALVKRLKDASYETCVISRHPERGDFSWKQLQSEGLPPCDGLVNLSGASIMAGRWTPAYKRKLFASRLDTTRMLVQAISASSNPPRVFISASGIGYYPHNTAQRYTEESAAGDDLLATLASQWEAVAELPEGNPTRLVILRIATVLGRGGGALQQMLPVYRKGLGGACGKGTQAFPWIHMDDLTGLILFCLKEGAASGPINAVAPGVVSNREFSHALAAAVGRKARLRLPKWLLECVLGERASLLLRGQDARPKRALELGFKFQYPTVEEALAELTRNT